MWRLITCLCMCLTEGFRINKDGLVTSKQPYKFSPFPPYKFSTVSPYKFSTVSPYRLSSVSPYKLSAVSPYKLPSVSPYSLSSVSPYNLSSVSPFKLSSVSPYTLSSVLPYKISSITPYMSSTASPRSTQTVSNLEISSSSYVPEEKIPPCQDCSCGERNEEPRIVGGLGSKVNAFPWLARLIYHKAFGCGASLINDRYVISAAHCVKGFMWFMFRVTFGEHDRCDFSQRPETRYVVKLIAHNFTLTELTNDITLLKLNEAVTYSHAVRPVCLPRNPVNSYVGASAIVAGWGATAEAGNWSCSLLQADLPVLSNEDCQNTKYNASKIREKMVCAGYPATAHKDACTGDSGGPLITENSDHAYELIGIVSWGYGCARKGYPGVYTRVNKYLDWIKDNTEDGCYCKY